MRRHVRHACDSCKRRKAKCDGEPPACSSCRALGLQCEYSIPRAKRGPKPRVPRAPSAPTSDSASSPNHTAGSGRIQSGGQTSDGSAVFHISPNVSHASASPWMPGGGLSSTPAGEWPGTSQVLRPSYCPGKVHEYLTAAAECHHIDLEQAVPSMVELYISTFFSLFPVFSAREIMQGIPLLLPSARHHFTTTAHEGLTGEHEPPRLDRMRAFTFLTAICAHLTCRSGEDGNREVDRALADMFLAASRGMLMCYEDADIAQPVTNSPLIRVLHSSVLHHQGKNRQSRFLVGQALRLVLDMRLFDEESLKSLGPLEAQLRRNLFWCLYTSDKSLSLLNNLPLTLYDHLGDPSFLELGPDGSPVRLLDGLAGPKYQASFEELVRPGFDLSNKQWLLAGDIVRDLDVLSRLCPGSSIVPEGLRSVSSSVTRKYTGFCSLLDVTPAWVSNPESHMAEGDDEEATAFQRDAFRAQHANLIVTMHCLKLILMVKAYRQGCAALIGFAENEDLFALRNTEVACELVNDSARVPLSALRANGEAMVEKFRSVGVILLEISHRVSDEAIAARAKALFTRLLDLIARLDSRTSDNLGGEAP